MMTQEQILVLDLEKQIKRHQELKNKLLLGLEFENSQIGILMRTIDELEKK
jgi:hypothetical protein